jgi:hypothetical protein
MISLPDRFSIREASNLSLDPRLQRLIGDSIEPLTPAGRFDLSGMTHFLVVEPGDAEVDIAEEIGLSPLFNPLDGSRFGSPGFQPWWDWLRDLGGWFELTITVGNSGFAYVLFIQDAEGVWPDLLNLCRAYAE